LIANKDHKLGRREKAPLVVAAPCLSESRRLELNSILTCTGSHKGIQRSTRLRTLRASDFG